MAESANALGTFSGRPDHRINLYGYVKDQRGNSSLIAWALYAERTGPWYGSFNLGSFPWTVDVGGRRWSGRAALGFTASRSSILISTGEDWFVHDGAGNLTVSISAAMQNADQFGSAYASPQSITPKSTIRPPSPPRNLRVANLAPTNAGVWYDGPADWRGSTLDHYVADWYEINNTNNPLVWRDVNSQGYTSPNGGATPGSFVPKPETVYQVYIYTETNAGQGEAAMIQLTTLPPSAPGVIVSPALSGRTADVKMTPPGGVSGVSSYSVEYRLMGSSTATTKSTTTDVLTVTGLTPGSRYQYRAQAVIGTYRSPWSEWVPITQPSPSTEPGDYFDGSTPAKTDTTYVWTGTPGKSVSTATAKSLVGWLNYADGAGGAQGFGIVSRAAGGFQAQRSARVLFMRDTVAPGFIAGIGFDGAGAVEPKAPYWGSIYAQMYAEPRRLQPGIAWYKANGDLISRSWGLAVEVDRSEGNWRRFSVRAVAPAGAAKGAPIIRDVLGGFAYGRGPYGSGPYGGDPDYAWTPFVGGDFILLDAAMLTLSTLFPYFDGWSKDTPEYRYDWLGEPDASASSRTPLDPAGYDPLADPDCPPPPTLAAVPAVPASCIEETGVWRRYWVAIPEEEIGEWKEVVPTISITTASSAARQLRVRIYRNPGDGSVEAINPEVWESEQILSFVPARTTMVLDGTDERAYAIINGETRDAGRLLYGTGGVPASWPTLSCGTGYAVAFDVPLEAPVGNETIEIQLTERV